MTTAVALALLALVVPQSSAVAQDNSPRADCYRYITVVNSGAFLIRWTARIQTPGGGVLSGDTTGNYSNGNTRTLDFGKYALITGQRIWPRVKAVAGETTSGAAVQYCSGGGTAVYNASGTTFNLSVTLLT